VTSGEAVPRVTVGVPVYNGAAFLARALDSLLGQTFEDFELVLSDNASTDETARIAEDYARRDRRVRIVHQPTNIGAAPNFNAVLAEARAPYFRWAAHDDLVEPTYLEKCVALLDARPEVVLCHSDVVKIDENDARIGSYPRLLDRAASASAVRRFRALLLTPHPCFDVFGLMRTDVLRRTIAIGSFTSSDRVLLAELALHGPFAWVDEPLFLSRDHGSRSIRRNVYQRAGWFDTKSGRRRVVLPFWRLGHEYARSILRVPLSTLDRLRAYATVSEWRVRHAIDLARDLKWAATGLLQRSPSGTA
jgi:glycosyltransferase involved in cell wall biosynthesis